VLEKDEIGDANFSAIQELIAAKMVYKWFQALSELISQLSPFVFGKEKLHRS